MKERAENAVLLYGLIQLSFFPRGRIFAGGQVFLSNEQRLSSLGRSFLASLFSSSYFPSR